MKKIVKVFDFINYKTFVLQYLQQLPKKGHGQLSRIAEALGVHTTMVTHVLKGDLHLGPEQALALSEFLGLNDLETEYFVNLVGLARAGDQRTKKYYSKNLETLKEKASNLRDRLQVKNALDESDQAIFYSTWIYTALRLLSAIPEYQSARAMAEKLNLPQKQVNKSLEFLLSRGLCAEKDNRIVYGDVKTYLESGSPLVTRHHINWRMKLIEQLQHMQPDELAFTFPVVIAEKDYAKIREEIVRMIEQVKKISDPSESEKLYCMTIDWLEIQR